MRTLLLFVFCAGITLSAAAQTPTAQKIGYADWEYIFSEMPEYKQISDQLTTHGAQLENQFKSKQQEFETKLKAYQQNMATMNEVVKKSTETELTQLNENLQKFQQDAMANIETKKTTLMGPIITRIGKAVEDVAKENGYDFILAPGITGQGGSSDILLYGNDKYDISNLVLKKLGVTPKPTATPAPGK